VGRKNNLNHTIHFTSDHSKFNIKKISTLVYLMETLNLKDEHLKYYFRKIKNLIWKNHNSKYIIFLIIKILPNHPWYQCYHIMLSLNPKLTKGHYMKVDGVHIHWLWIATSFWVLVWKSMILWLLKNWVIGFKTNMGSWDDTWWKGCASLLLLITFEETNNNWQIS
jgi:hypothetical protein